MDQAWLTFNLKLEDLDCDIEAKRKRKKCNRNFLSRQGKRYLSFHPAVESSHRISHDDKIAVSDWVDAVDANPNRWIYLLMGEAICHSPWNFLNQ